MEFDSTFRLLTSRYGPHNATTYCRLRFHGMTATEALWWMREQRARLRRAGEVWDFDILYQCRHAYLRKQRPPPHDA
jgi:hypothetical protein